MSTLRSTARTLAEQYYRAQYKLRGVPSRFVFLLGTMRCGSTLVSHILTSNPEITGFGESHLHYASIEDLEPLVAKVHQSLRLLRLRGPYVFDKILHDDISTDELFHSDRCYFLIMLREPRGAISSMCRHFPNWFTDRRLDPDVVLEKASAYYERRLCRLVEYAEAIDDRRRAMFFTYDEFVDHAPTVFCAIEQFLDLRTPLSEEYAAHRLSGVKGVGDTSQKLASGTIQRDRPVRSFDLEPLPELDDAFRQCSSALRELCTPALAAETV